MCKSNEITKQQLKSLENEEKKPHEEVNMCKQSGRCSSRTTKKPPTQDLKKKTPDFKTKPEKGNLKRKCKYCGKQMHIKRQDCPALAQRATSARKTTISRRSVIQRDEMKLILSKMKTTRILISQFSQWM